MATMASLGPLKSKKTSGSLTRPIVKLIPVFESSVLGPEDVANAIACKRK